MSENNYKKIGYNSLLNMSYEEAIHYLLNKYGEVSDDYFKEKSYARFLRGEIKTITKGKYSKTSEGYTVIIYMKISMKISLAYTILIVLNIHLNIKKKKALFIVIYLNI